MFPVLGIEINPEYVNLIRNRLDKSFNGFDSIDPRMERVPLDLRDINIRQEYLENHKIWFLNNHHDYIEKFNKEVEKMYGKLEKTYQNMLLFG